MRPALPDLPALREVPTHRQSLRRLECVTASSTTGASNGSSKIGTAGPGSCTGSSKGARRLEFLPLCDRAVQVCCALFGEDGRIAPVRLRLLRFFTAKRREDAADARARTRRRKHRNGERVDVCGCAVERTQPLGERRFVFRRHQGGDQDQIRYAIAQLLECALGRRFEHRAPRAGVPARWPAAGSPDGDRVRWRG